MRKQEKERMLPRSCNWDLHSGLCLPSLCSNPHAKLLPEKRKTKLLVLRGPDLPLKPPLLRTPHSNYTPAPLPALSTAWSLRSHRSPVPPGPSRSPGGPSEPQSSTKAHSMVFSPRSYSPSLPAQSSFLPQYYVHSFIIPLF